MTLETSSLRRTASAFAVFILLVALLSGTPRGPISHGQPLLFWLRQLRLEPASRHTETTEALVALQSSATDALRRTLTQRAPVWARGQAHLHRLAPSLIPLPPPVESSRALAIEVLQRLENRASAFIPELVQAFRVTTRPDHKDAIAQILHALGDSGMAALATLALEPDFSGSEAAIRTLDDLLHSRAATPDIRSQWALIASSRLLSADAEVVLAATRALGRLGPEGIPGIVRIRTHLSHPLPAVRAASAEALSRVGRHDSHSCPALIVALDDSSDAVKAAAAAALGRFGAEAAAAVPRLEQALGDASIPVVLAVLQTLGRIGPAASKAVNSIARRLHHDSDPALLKSAAALSLGRIARQPEHAIPALEQAMRDPDAYVRSQAVRALSAYGAQAAPCVPALTEALLDPVEAVRIHAAEALGNVGAAAQGAIPALIAARNNNQSVMSPPVVAALARIQGKDPAAP